MQRTYRIGTARKLEPDDGHAKRLALILRFDPAQAHQLLARNPQRLPQRTKMLFDQSGIEAIVPCRDGRVGREDRVLGYLAQGVVKRQAIVFHSFANDFQRGKCAMTFVEMIDARKNA